jgi:Pyruvate/2-oxoacid:ferredoxin oxidoreductase gamma subunit
VEREVFMSGIGGQGIQVVTKMLAQAANIEGRYVMHFGYYMGSVRGGQSDCTVVIGTEEIQAPPIIPKVWGAIAMHPEFFKDAVRKMRPGGLLLVNTSLIEEAPDRTDLHTIEIPASKMALEMGSIISASMIAMGAFIEATGIVEMDHVEAAMIDLLPPYRHHHIPANKKALQLGVDYIRGLPEGVRGGVRAWEAVPA